MAHRINPFGTLQHEIDQCISCYDIIMFEHIDTYKQCGCPNAQSYLCSNCFDGSFDNLSDDEFCVCGAACEEYHSYSNSPEKHPDKDQNSLTYGFKDDHCTKMGLIPLYMDIGMVKIRDLKRKMQLIVNTSQIFKCNMIVNVSDVILKRPKSKFNVQWNLCISSNGDFLWVTADDPIIQIIFYNKSIAEIVELYQNKSSKYQLIFKKISLSKYNLKCVTWFEGYDSDLFSINYKIIDAQMLDFKNESQNHNTHATNTQ